MLEHVTAYHQIDRDKLRPVKRARIADNQTIIFCPKLICIDIRLPDLYTDPILPSLAKSSVRSGAGADVDDAPDWRPSMNGLEDASRPQLSCWAALRHG